MNPNKNAVDGADPGTAAFLNAMRFKMPMYDDEESNTKDFLEISMSRDLFYSMESNHRGKCIIFNHKKFDVNGMGERKGTDKDVLAIKKVFGEVLNFEVKVHEDLTYTQIDTELSHLGENDYRDYSCMCIFVLTHGERNGKLYAYDTTYSFSTLWKPFTGDKCPTLVGKPKLFFIQACRGAQADPGVRLFAVSKHMVLESPKEWTCKIPITSDFLIGYSSIEEFVSWRNENVGSWYIQTLCKTLEEYWETTDLFNMLTIASRRVATKERADCNKSGWNSSVQMPCFYSSLTKNLLFRRKYKGCPSSDS